MEFIASDVKDDTEFKELFLDATLYKQRMAEQEESRNDFRENLEKIWNDELNLKDYDCHEVLEWKNKLEAECGRVSGISILNPSLPGLNVDDIPTMAKQVEQNMRSNNKCICNGIELPKEAVCVFAYYCIHALNGTY